MYGNNANTYTPSAGYGYTPYQPQNQNTTAGSSSIPSYSTSYGTPSANAYGSTQPPVYNPMQANTNANNYGASARTTPAPVVNTVPAASYQNNSYGSYSIPSLATLPSQPGVSGGANLLAPPTLKPQQSTGGSMTRLPVSGQLITPQTTDEDGNQKMLAAIAKRESEANREVYEGEKYDPLKQLSQEQIETYGRQGIEDYLTCLRLSTKSRIFTKYDKLLKTLEVQDAQDYKDEEFPAELQSLVGTNVAGRNSWKGLKWLRPKDIQGYGTNTVLFEGNIEPNDIRQGYLGDCYFLSTMASLAEWPERIKSLFKNDKQNKFGCHSVRVCDKGEWKDIIVDEFIPCVSAARGPAFTKGNQGEIWVILLEKAWAKINGSYDGIEAGLTRECLHDFTGAPTQTLWLDEPSSYDQVWNKLVIGEKNNYAMTCGSTDAKQKNELDQVGIISGHAYSLLGAYEVNYQGQPTRLVKLRNPWGEREWNGAWKDGDSKFNQLSSQDLQKLDILERARNGTTDDGIFFMDYDDFRKYFTDAQVCYVHDSFQYVSLKSSSTKKAGKFFNLTITEKGRYFICVNQKSKRKYPKDFQREFKYSAVTLIVSKKEANGTSRYIEGVQREDREVWVGESETAILEPGQYTVFVKTQWRYNDQEEFVLSVYGQGKAKMNEITKVEAQNFLAETYFSHANTVSKRQKKLLQDGKAWILIDQTEDGYFYLAVDNQSTKTMTCEFKLAKMTGLKLKKPFSGQNVRFLLPPGQHQTAILRVKDYKLIQALSVSQTVSFK